MHEAKDHLAELLQRIAQSLDIHESLYEEAVDKYTEVGEHLRSEDSPLHRFSPNIYPQGSFRLGTMIRPLTEKDEYDIDLVCRLRIEKQNMTQKELKDRVGDRLKDREDFRQILEERRRCWTLHFEDRFHMDVLPAIPDEDGPDDSILITDKELRLWQHSDPIGYAHWFWERMKLRAEEQLKSLAESLRMSVEHVPRWKVKTPLQRAVQILKRHRDMYFQDDPEDKPVSIIITTLAAKAYDNEANLYEALVGIVRDMPKHIENRNGIFWVENPVNSKENFADKWQDYPERRKKFFAWLHKVHQLFMPLLYCRGLHEIADLLGAGLGRPLVTKAMKALASSFRQQSTSGHLRMAAGTGTLGTSGSVKVKGHTFFGDVDETKDS